jgi:hypothetical protein
VRTPRSAAARQHEREDEIQRTRRKAAGSPQARSRPLRHESRITSHESRPPYLPITTHQSQAFLIDIRRLEIAVIPWKQTMRARSNRHNHGTRRNRVFVRANIESAPRRVLASRFSALRAPSPWCKGSRVHRAHPPGGGIVMWIPMQTTSCAVLAVSTRNACSAGASNGKRKLENWRRAATLAPIFSFRFSNFDSADVRGDP